jgi:hypothetical protein
MALKNLTSDLSDYFKKEPSKPTGRFQQPDREMSDLDVHGKLETYKRPEIKSDPAGNPIIPTNFDQPDTKTRYTDNFESKLIRLASVDITQTSLEGRFETSPVKVNEISISGNNETSTYDPEQTNPKGRNEESNIVIPTIATDGRFEVSGIDPVISVLKGRFETSNIEPIQSVLEGYQVKTDGNGNKLPSHIEIENTTTFGIQNEGDLTPAIYQYGKAVKSDGSLVSINDSDSHTFSERPVKSGGALPYSSLLDVTGNPSSYSTSLNSINGIGTFHIHTTTGTNTAISSNLAFDNVQSTSTGQAPENYYWSSQGIASINQPFRVGYHIDATTEIHDKINNKYTTDFNTIGFIEPDGSTQHRLQDISAINIAPATYISQLTPSPLNYVIPFDATDANSVTFNFGYDIITNAISNNQGQTFTVLSSATSPYSDITITGLHSGNIDTLHANNASVFGLDMVQSFIVDGQDTITPISEVTITGGKDSFTTDTLEDSQTIGTPLFGGKTYEQVGKTNPTVATDVVTLADQIELGNSLIDDHYTVGFTPNMSQTFGGGEEGSKYLGIENDTYTHPGISNRYSHKSIVESAFGQGSTFATANTGTPTAISYDVNSHLTPVALRTFTINSTGPINNIQLVNGTDEVEFQENFSSARTGQVGGAYIHRLGPYGMDTTITGVAGLSSDMQNELPKLYNDGSGITQYGIPLGDKPKSYEKNFEDNTVDEGTSYGSYIIDKIKSGADEKWYESAFPALSGKNLSSAKAGFDELKKMMKRKKTYRIWETHNSYTLQGNQGLHKGLEHFGIVSGGSSLADGWFPEFTNIAQAGNTTANRYYSVLGYPGLMVAYGVASSGAVSHLDFRALINDPLATFYGESTIANYDVNNLVSRGGSYNQGRPGLARRDYRQATTKTKPYGGDAITQQAITGVDIKAMEKEYGDLIKFYIKDPIGKKTLRFRSYITAINDSVGATWTGVKYLGRPNNLFLYEGASDRKLSFNLKVAALSRYDVKMMWTKVNYLTSLCYPHIDEATQQMKGPVVGLTLGDWFNDEPGFFDSVNITVDTSAPWDINLEDHNYRQGLGGQLLDSAMKGGISGLVNTGLNKLKDVAKGTLGNQAIDKDGRQVAQLPQVIDITLGFTSMASANRKVGGDMFGFMDADGAWVTDKEGKADGKFPKPSLLDRVMGGGPGSFASSGAGKVLGGVLGRR